MKRSIIPGERLDRQADQARDDDCLIPQPAQQNLGSSPGSSNIARSVKLYLLLAGGFLALAFAQTFNQTLVGPTQLANVPQIQSQFGFMCTTVGPSTVCQVDTAYMMHLEPIPFNGSAVPPTPGPCPSTGSVIVTNEPAAYFCAVKMAGGLPTLNWMRVAGVSTW